jgi:hypothetical protein
MGENQRPSKQFWSRQANFGGKCDIFAMLRPTTILKRGILFFASMRPTKGERYAQPEHNFRCRRHDGCFIGECPNSI